jgi:hypothetical protein
MSERASRQLQILALRSLELADRVAAGEIAFLDAVDIAYEAAVWSGLTSTNARGLGDATVVLRPNTCDIPPRSTWRQRSRRGAQRAECGPEALKCLRNGGIGGESRG